MKKFFVFSFIFGLSALCAFAVDYNSQFVSQSVPTTLYTGQKKTVYVTFKNTGTSTWTKAASIGLGSENPRDNRTWGLNRIYLGSADNIAPGGNKTFKFTVTAPSTPGSYNFQWRMLKIGVKWFGAYSTNKVINVIKPDYDAQYISQSVQTNMVTGKSYQVNVGFKNTGTKSWTRADNIRLGSLSPTNNSIWGFGRVYLGGTEVIKPGQTKIFNFTVTAPANPGSYNFHWQMLKEGVKWFGDTTPRVVVTVSIPYYNAQFISQDVPTQMNAGEQYPVSITFKNTGDEAWNKDDLIRLGSQSPTNNSIWGFGRVYLGGTEIINPGQTKVFNFNVTAPCAGTYNFQWQMLQEGVKWFGDSSPIVVVGVVGDSAVGVDITGPAAEENLSGISPVTVNVTGSIIQAEFYVDGYLYDSVSSSITGSYTFNWDTAVNHLPEPHDSLTDYVYYGVTGVHTDAQLHFDYTSEVNGYTNSYIASRAGYKYNPDSDWIPMMTSDIANAAAQNRRIALDLTMNNATYAAETNPTHLEKVLDIVEPYWDSITRIEVVHEPGTWQEIEPKIDEVEQALVDRGLAGRPMGIMLGPQSSVLDYLDSIPNLDWVGIEAYIDAPGSDISRVNIDELNNVLNNAMNKVPPDKDIVLVMMAYTRNGAWTNLDTLRDLQVPTYLKACEDQRVVSIRMFAYHRPGGGLNVGTRENPVLITPHKLIAEKFLGITLNPPDGPAVNGRRTVRVKVYNNCGQTAEDLVVVNVNN